MKELSSFAALAVLLGLSPLVRGDAPLVYCGCDQGEYGGPGYYSYPIDSASYPMMEFTVGTNDLNPGYYLDVSVPPGWNFIVEEVPMAHACGLFAYHGFLSGGPCYGLTAGRVRWWTDDPACAIESFTFSFIHPWRAEDVGWMLTTRREGPPPEYFTMTECWDAPVGTGMGPLHGPWAPADWCWSDQECDPNEYCFFHVCAAETGMCMPRPQTCPEYYDPVCGCDGVTYDNACFAALAGMSVDYEGECGTVYCWSSGDCAGHQYCAKAVGDCNGQGECEPRPDICPPLWDPVCGCDGVSYPNECVAAVEGVSVDYWGACDGEPCWSDDDCGPTSYCFFDDCLAETGACVRRPEFCPEVWDPVCGCDGVTYGNDCVAAMAGMSLAYHDECLVGDLDLDGDVDLNDLSALLGVYGKCVGDPGYWPRADFDNSGCIDLHDLAEILGHYGDAV